MWADAKYIALLESERERLTKELAEARTEISRLNRALIFASPAGAAAHYQSMLADEQRPKPQETAAPGQVDWTKPWPEVVRQWEEIELAEEKSATSV